MAAAYNTSTGGGVNDAGATTQDSASIAVPSNAVVYVLVGSSAGSPADPSGCVWDPTGANQSLTKLGSTISHGTFARASLYRIISPTAGTAVFRATWPSTQTERFLTVWVGTGIDAGTPNGTIISAQGTNNAPSTGAITTTTGQLVVAIASHLYTGGTAVTYDSPTGTERVEYAISGTPYDGSAAQDFVATGTSTTLGWTVNGATLNSWAIFGIPLNEGSGGAQVGVATETDTALAPNSVNAADIGDLFLFGDDTSNESSMGGLKLFGGFPASGASSPVGLAVESSTALALLGVQRRAAGLAVETNSALALGSAVAAPVGLAAETDAALAMAAVQRRAVGMAEEADLALALSAAAGTPVGLASETDAAFALAAVQARSVGLATETDAALALSAPVGNQVGIAVEANVALSLAGLQLRAVGLATEVDSGLALGATHIRVTGVASETDAALARTAVQLLPTGVATETDAALFLSAGGPVPVGLAAEINTAFALDGLQIGLSNGQDGASPYKKWRYYTDEESQEPPKPQPPEPAEPETVVPAPAPKPQPPKSTGELLRTVQAMAQQRRQIAEELTRQESAMRQAVAKASQSRAAAEQSAIATIQAAQAEALEQELEDDDQEAIALALTMLDL